MPCATFQKPFIRKAPREEEHMMSLKSRIFHSPHISEREIKANEGHTVHSLNWYLLNSYYVSGIVLGSGIAR